MSTILKDLREEKSYTQHELANILGIARQTLAKYEKGTVPLSADIIKKLSIIFDVTYSCFIDNKRPTKTLYNVTSSDKQGQNTDLRINIPQENIEKFEQIFLYILNKIGAKPNINHTTLQKILYLIDFNYYELFEEQLMGLKYKKISSSLVLVDFENLIKNMKKQNAIEEISTKNFNIHKIKYLPVIKPILSLLSAQDLLYIDKELSKFSDKDDKELLDFIKKDIPFLGANTEDILEYEAVFYRNDETSLREYND